MKAKKMSPVDQLSHDLKQQFPDAEIEIRKSDDPNGFQFVSLVIGDFEVGVEWKKEHGFGIPKGIEHKPFAERECQVMVLVRAGTVNTGDAPPSERTADPAATV